MKFNPANSFFTKTWPDESDGTSISPYFNASIPPGDSTKTAFIIVSLLQRSFCVLLLNLFDGV